MITDLNTRTVLCDFNTRYLLVLKTIQKKPIKYYQGLEHQHTWWLFLRRWVEHIKRPAMRMSIFTFATNRSYEPGIMNLEASSCFKILLGLINDKIWCALRWGPSHSESSLQRRSLSLKTWILRRIPDIETYTPFWIPSLALVLTYETSSLYPPRVEIVVQHHVDLHNHR